MRRRIARSGRTAGLTTESWGAARRTVSEIPARAAVLSGTNPHSDASLLEANGLLRTMSALCAKADMRPVSPMSLRQWFGQRRSYCIAAKGGADIIGSSASALARNWSGLRSPRLARDNIRRAIISFTRSAWLVSREDLRALMYASQITSTVL